MEKAKLKKEIGLFTATSLVVGNMMGSGIFMLPATLAQVASPGSILIAWILTGLGALVLSLTYANLGSKIPKTGGVYEYTRLAYGNFMGFTSAWLYWNGSWIGNATIFIVVTTYLGEVITTLTSKPIIGFLFCSALLWIATYINIRGTKLAGKINCIITIFKILLFIFFIVIGLLNFNIANLNPLFPSGKGINTVPIAAALTLWAFMGLETATVAGGEIKNPEKNIKRSTILGMLISTLLYIAISVVAMGAMQSSNLSKSIAPISDIISKGLGLKNITILNIAIAISILGTGFGWLLSTARVAYAAGEDGIFPKVFSKLHPKYDTPYVALIIGSIAINIIFLLNFTKGLSNAYNFIVILATLSYLPIYASTAIGEIILLLKGEQKSNLKNYIGLIIRGLIGFIFSVWAIIASGQEVVMYGFLLIMMGIPLYAYMKIKKEFK
ncbi:APC family permease [Clostridium tarantellae]|uniref:Amino acid permease n=1 Tax=Clostridium tarantellae TaxID=39493 RepID=A0A6I1MQZ6_9CLOT|nr:amino acid permease [Clostridium tarantellae]MPQ43311.1 amino acid permease [Clostridium tarantellae]